MRARNPLAAEKLCEESLDAEECLTALFSAYSNKKERARVASAAKRAIDRLARVKLGLATAADADAPADVEVEAEAAMIPGRSLGGSLSNLLSLYAGATLKHLRPSPRPCRGWQRSGPQPS